MAFWNNSFLQKRRTAWMNSISKAQYYADGTWYDGTITEKSISDNTIYVKFTTSDSLALTITQVRLLDTSLEVAGTQTNINIIKSAAQGVLLQIAMPLTEVAS